jgi:hypothetical protein
MKTKPMTMLLMMIAGWMNREQQEVIEYCRITIFFLLTNGTNLVLPGGM